MIPLSPLGMNPFSAFHPSFSALHPVIAQTPAPHSSPEPMKVLSSALREKLAHSVQASKEGNQPETDDFSPDAVSTRIVGFIANNLQHARQRGADPATIEHVLDASRRGVEQGFAEARDILEQLGMLQGKVARDIDETYEKIQQGLNHLSTTDLGSAVTADAAHYSENKQFSMQLRTRDGDKIQLNFAQLQSAERVSSTDKKSHAYDESFNFSAQWQMRVEGNLDEGEQTALKRLLNDVEELGNSFYSGDLQTAWEQATSLDFDRGEFSRFSLQMTHSMSVAVSQYRETAGISPQPTPPSSLRQLKEQMDNMMKEFNSAFTRFDQPDLFKTLFENLLNLAHTLPQERSNAAITPFGNEKE